MVIPAALPANKPTNTQASQYRSDQAGSSRHSRITTTSWARPNHAFNDSPLTPPAPRIVAHYFGSTALDRGSHWSCERGVAPSILDAPRGRTISKSWGSNLEWVRPPLRHQPRSPHRYEIGGQPNIARG